METQDIINMLQEFWQDNPHSFEFNASILLAGPSNTTRLREIIKLTTGKEVPKSKAGYHATINALQNVFSQTTLF